MEYKNKQLIEDGFVLYSDVARPYLQKLVEALNIQKTDKVLELGGGTFFSAGLIYEKNPKEHHIVDISFDKCAALFPEKEKGTKQIKNDYRKFLKSNTVIYNKIFIDVFYTIQDLHEEDTFKNLHKALDPNGKMVFFFNWAVHTTQKDYEVIRKYFISTLYDQIKTKNYDFDILIWTPKGSP